MNASQTTTRRSHVVVPAFLCIATIGIAACADPSLDSAHGYSVHHVLHPNAVIRNVTFGLVDTDENEQTPPEYMPAGSTLAGWPACSDIAVRLPLLAGTEWDAVSGDAPGGYIAAQMHQAGVITQSEFDCLNTGYWSDTYLKTEVDGVIYSVSPRCDELFGQQTGREWLEDRVDTIPELLPACTAGWYLVENPNGGRVTTGGGLASGLMCGDYLNLETVTTEDLCVGAAAAATEEDSCFTEAWLSGDFQVTVAGTLVFSGYIDFDETGDYCSAGTVTLENQIAGATFDAPAGCFGIDGIFTCPFAMDTVNRSTNERGNWTQHFDLGQFTVYLPAEHALGASRAFSPYADPECQPR